MAIKSKLEAVAQHLGQDAADIKEGRYHYGRTSGPVWTSDENYYSATKLNGNGSAGKPPTHRDGTTWNWRKASDLFLASQGWQVWVAMGSDTVTD